MIRALEVRDHELALIIEKAPIGSREARLAADLKAHRAELFALKNRIALTDGDGAGECGYCHGIGACPKCWGRAAITKFEGKLAAVDEALDKADAKRFLDGEPMTREQRIAWMAQNAHGIWEDAEKLRREVAVLGRQLDKAKE